MASFLLASWLTKEAFYTIITDWSLPLNKLLVFFPSFSPLSFLYENKILASSAGLKLLPNGSSFALLSIGLILYLTLIFLMNNFYSILSQLKAFFITQKKNKKNRLLKIFDTLSRKNILVENIYFSIYVVALYISYLTYHQGYTQWLKSYSLLDFALKLKLLRLGDESIFFFAIQSLLVFGGILIIATIASIIIAAIAFVIIVAIVVFVYVTSFLLYCILYLFRLQKISFVIEIFLNKIHTAITDGVKKGKQKQSGQVTSLDTEVYSKTKYIAMSIFYSLAVLAQIAWFTDLLYASVVFLLLCVVLVNLYVDALFQKLGKVFHFFSLVFGLFVARPLRSLYVAIAYSPISLLGISICFGMFLFVLYLSGQQDIGKGFVVIFGNIERFLQTTNDLIPNIEQFKSNVRQHYSVIWGFIVWYFGISFVVSQLFVVLFSSEDDLALVYIKELEQKEDEEQTQEVTTTEKSEQQNKEVTATEKSEQQNKETIATEKNEQQ